MRFRDVYVLGETLGQGTFGQVRAARPKAAGGCRELAVKILDVCGTHDDGEPTEEVSSDRERATRTEISMWEAVGTSEHCVRLQAVFFEETRCYMVMEKCNGSLMDKLRTPSAVKEADLIGIFVDMLLALQHIHSLCIVHRDIKPDNFLFGGHTVKLCDFGLAAKMPPQGLLMGVYGTAPYMSPEMLAGHGYDTLTDVWSFGATAFLLIHGDSPYSPRLVTGEAMKNAIVAGRPAIKFVRPPDETPLFSMGFVDRATPFLRALLRRTPATRLSATDALEFPLLSLDRQSSKTPSIPAAKAPQAPGRKAVQEIKKPASPSMQRSLSQVLLKLHSRLGVSSASTAEPAWDDVDDSASGSASEARPSTPSGVVSVAAAGFNGRGIGIQDLHDAASTATPDSGGGTGRSPCSNPSFGNGAHGPVPCRD